MNNEKRTYNLNNYNTTYNAKFYPQMYIPQKKKKKFKKINNF